MTTRMTPHGEQEIDDFYEAHEAIPCVNCGSPACEWPGECESVSRAAGRLAVEVAASHVGPNTAAVLREYVAHLERTVDRLVPK